MRTFDLSPLIQERTLTFYDHIDLILKDDEFRSTVKEIFRSLEELDTKYTNLVWLYHNIDTLRTDHVFQEAVGLQLAQEGYTCSMEVVGGISKTMSDMWNKIVEFFRKMMQYLQEVFLINTKAAAELCTKLAEQCNDPKKVDKLKKEYTTHGESVLTLTALFKLINETADDRIKDVAGIKQVISDQEKIKAEGAEQKANSTETKLKELQQKLQQESGNGDDQQNTQDGMDPINGKWFDAGALKDMASSLTNLTSYVGKLRQMQSDVRAVSNNVKSDTQQSKELAKTRLDTLKKYAKAIDNEVKFIMRCSTLVGKKCQVLLKITEK